MQRMRVVGDHATDISGIDGSATPYLRLRVWMQTDPSIGHYVFPGFGGVC